MSLVVGLIEGLLDVVLEPLELHPIFLLDGAPLIQRPDVFFSVGRLGSDGSGINRREFQRESLLKVKSAV